MIQIYEDFIPKQYQDELESVLMSPSFPWEYREKAIPDYLEDKNLVDTPPYTNPFQFKHVFFYPPLSKSHHFDLIKPLMYFFSDRTGYKIEHIIAAVAIMLMPAEENYTILPHVDKDYKKDPNNELRTLIYYVNDADGPTTMYHEMFEGKKLDSVTIAQELYPKKGRGAVFNSDRFHSGSQPTKNRRLLISIVMEVSK